jgi:hypothetical protein
LIIKIWLMIVSSHKREREKIIKNLNQWIWKPLSLSQLVVWSFSCSRRTRHHMREKEKNVRVTGRKKDSNGSCLEKSLKNVCLGVHHTPRPNLRRILSFFLLFPNIEFFLQEQRVENPRPVVVRFFCELFYCNYPCE